MISEKFEAGTTVKDELSVTHPGTYILRWDNTHSRMRGKQIQCERIPRPSLHFASAAGGEAAAGVATQLAADEHSAF
eukprot:COSAG02_NODE_6802_length_3352_cov_2.056871_4_plen_76_part_01